MAIKPYMSPSEYARYRGVSPKYVSECIDLGRVAVTLIGTKRVIDVVKSDKILATATLGRKNKLFNKKPPTEKEAAKFVEPEEEEAPVKPGGVPTYTQSRAMHEALKANLANLELQKKSGRYIDAERVRSDYTNLCRTIRNGVLSLPDRVAPVITTLTVEEAHILLTEECNKILENLANGIRTGI
jgi:hypothetical protein